MGSQKVLKSIKRGSIAFVVLGVLLGIPVIIATCYSLASERPSVTTVSIFLLFSLLCIFSVFWGMRTLLDPSKASIFKKNPYVLQMADELYANIRYQDDFIVMSDRFFAPKADPSHVTPFTEVFLIYIQKQTTNFIPTGKMLHIETARGFFQINIYGKKKEKVNALIQAIASVCPYLRIGYTQENLAYSNEMKRIWQHNTNDGQQ